VRLLGSLLAHNLANPCFGREPKARVATHMNKKHLNNLIVIVGMTKFLNGLKETLPFLSKLRKIAGYYKVFYKRKVKEGKMLANSAKS